MISEMQFIDYLFFLYICTETELMSEIEKISEEKHLLLQKISQLEQNIQKSSTSLIKN